jgi:hypothetical protein
MVGLSWFGKAGKLLRMENERRGAEGSSVWNDAWG